MQYFLLFFFFLVFIWLFSFRPIIDVTSTWLKFFSPWHCILFKFLSRICIFKNFYCTVNSSIIFRLSKVSERNNICRHLEQCRKVAWIRLFFPPLFFPLRSYKIFLEKKDVVDLQNMFCSNLMLFCHLFSLMTAKIWFLITRVEAKWLSCKNLQVSGRNLQGVASLCKFFFQKLASSYKLTIRLASSYKFTIRLTSYLQVNHSHTHHTHTTHAHTGAHTHIHVHIHTHIHTHAKTHKHTYSLNRK